MVRRRGVEVMEPRELNAHVAKILDLVADALSDQPLEVQSNALAAARDTIEATITANNMMFAKREAQNWFRKRK
jgi:hypothetical protein